MDPQNSKIPDLRNESLHIKILTRNGVSFEDQVNAITSYNDKGVFDVLPEHENFISIIKDKVIIHLKNGQTKEVKLESAVLTVKENEARIFLGLAGTG